MLTAMTLTVGFGLSARSGASALPVSSALSAISAGGVWRSAEEVPGTPGLNAGGNAGVGSVSCASPENCSAGGWYSDGSAIQAFVVSEVNGVWGTAAEVPGSAALNTGGAAGIDAVSCATAGDCSAGGHYNDGSGYQVFVVSEVNGVWGTAAEVPGSAALNSGVGALSSISCASPGNCAAGGRLGSLSTEQAFVVSQVNGVWGNAVVVPGSAALNTANFAGVDSVSCASAGDCSAGGFYTESGTFNQQGFVVTETGGTWGNAAELPSSALNVGGFAQIDSVSCSSAGNCDAGGFYNDGSGYQALVASQVSGTWDGGEALPGSATLNVGGHAEIRSVSCSSDGACGAVGYYTDGSHHGQGLLATEVNGAWTAQAAPGLAVLNAGGHAVLESVSCPAAGGCSAGGYYQDASGATQPAVISQANGTWQKAQELPGSGTLNSGGQAGLYQGVSCASAGHCGMGGFYTDGSGAKQAFVATEKPPSGTTTTLAMSQASVRYGHENAERFSVTVASPSAGPVPGKVIIKASATTLCQIMLKSGKGSCVPTAKKLRVGRYHIVAAYQGSTYFLPSVSPTKRLTVVK